MDTRPSTTPPAVIPVALHLKMRRNLYSYIAVACILAIAALFYALWAKYHKEQAQIAYSVTKADLDSVSKLAVHYYNKDSLDVVENISLKAQNEGSLRSLSDHVFHLEDKQEKLIKRVNYYAQIKQKVIVHTIPIPFDSGQHIPWVAKGRSDSIGVPQTFSISDTLKTIKGLVTKAGVRIDSIIIPNEVRLRSVTVKRGFLNLGRQDKVQAVNSSVLLYNEGIAEMSWKPGTSEWNKWIKALLAFLLGAGGMYYLTK